MPIPCHYLICIQEFKIFEGLGPHMCFVQAAARVVFRDVGWFHAFVEFPFCPLPCRLVLFVDEVPM
jgi:hypothetical protein